MFVMFGMKIWLHIMAKGWLWSFKSGDRSGICDKYFLSFPKKNLRKEKTETIYVFIFQFFLMINLTKTPLLVNCDLKMAFPGITIQKLKSKHWACVSFLKERKKTFYMYSRSNPKFTERLVSKFVLETNKSEFWNLLRCQCHLLYMMVQDRDLAFLFEDVKIL